MAISRRFPTDHHGALVPPPALVAALAALEPLAPEPGALALAQRPLVAPDVLDAAIAQVLIQQQDAWISQATDGELRRRYAPGPVDALAEARFVLDHGALAAKLRLPAPAPGAPLADAGQVAALWAMGVPYVQLDGAAYGPLVHGAGRAALRAAGRDPDAELDAALERDGAALAGLAPPEGFKLAIALHDVNDPSSAPFAQDLVPEAAQRLFDALPANRWLFDCGGAVDARDFAFLALLPGGVDAVLGLFDAVALPDPDTLVALIDAAATVIDTDRLALSPRHALAAVLAGPDAWARQGKVLDYLLDVATRAWGIDF